MNQNNNPGIYYSPRNRRDNSYQKPCKNPQYDYGYEHWVEKAVDFYGDEGDLLIVISSSGSSENMLNGVKAARNGKFCGVITLSGFTKENPLCKLGDINLWIDSKAYNFIENILQVWLLSIVDLIIGKREYLPN